MSVTSEHLSDLTLDRLLAEEREGLDGARAHLEGCAECRDALEARRAERDAWRARVDSRAFVQAVLDRAQTADVADPEPTERAAVLPLPFAASGGPGWSIGLVTGLAAAAAALTVVMTPHDSAPDFVGLKGDETVTLLVVDGDASRPVRRGEKLETGDRIGLSASCPIGCLLYLHDPADGHAALFGEPFVVPVGEPKVLDFTATLDDADRDEHLEVLMCRGSIPDDERLAALKQGRSPDDCLHRMMRVPRAAEPPK